MSWSSCCFIAIGVIAFAQEDSSVQIPDRTSSPLFGFQVQMDQDGTLNPKPLPQFVEGDFLPRKTSPISQVSYADFAEPVDDSPNYAGTSR
jgi:hypothetical protein